MTNSSAAPESEKLSLSTKLAYGAGDAGAGITVTILTFSLMVFFTNVAGLDPRTAGSILAIGKVFDAINDPIVGFLSDRTKSRWGRRHSWMILGAIPFGIFFFLQWIVPRFSDNPATNQTALFWYYVAISILFNTAFTAVNLPYTALTPELTQDYHERTSLNSFRFAFSIGGSILALILGLVISLVVPDSAQQYLALGAVCAVLSVFPIYWCVLGTKERYSSDSEISIPFFEQLKIVFSNRPFLYVIGIYLCSWLAFQLTATVLPYFTVNWMGLESYFAVALIVQAVAIVMLFVWSAVSKQRGKRVVYFLGMALWIIAQAGLFLLRPGQTALLFLLAGLAGVGVATAYLVPWSMLPDVIELDELQTGQRREGIFYAFMVLLQKIGLALALFLVGQALGAAGFIEATPGQPLPTQPDSALLAIRLVIAPLPTLTLIAGLVLAYFYPITREVHAEILLKLRERRQADRNSID
ncbi:MFS transporter [Microcoleus sp. FACHB-1515]|uniref:MFS transporter n=1 Tax=Cyanophyceae TaxID=3028117 RepID=UPI0016837AC2|nr:MFS transporter [Microcoleus sp. FACHB-1515]MBD2091711.1 MFS transporter [Microcoleus sp. FACHB-1515]